jgi:hypothetical protein
VSAEWAERTLGMAQDVKPVFWLGIIFFLVNGKKKHFYKVA